MRAGGGSGVPIGISYMSANEVARQLGYRMGDWGEGDRAANAWYAPIATFEARFGDLLDRVRGLGFTAIDVWTAHLNPAWATDEHVALSQGLLRRHGLRVVSLAGGFGSTVDEFEATCRLAAALERPILGGSAPLWRTDRAAVLDALERHDLRLAFENHPEKTPEEMIDLIGDAPSRVGTAVDTGWYGTQGYDAARAIETLGSRVMHVHLKDVRETGQHRTCGFGQGIVPIEGCVRALARMGYSGDISIEHEPHDYDPTDEVVHGAALLRGWLAEVPA
jgi:sugar phosphate isomerase/epimerase